jgi:hypothetical protein
MENHEARQRTKTRTASVSRPRRSVSAIALSRFAVVENASIPGRPHNLKPRRHQGVHTTNTTKTHATHDYAVTCCLSIDKGGTSIGSPPARIAARMLLRSAGTPAKNKLLRLQGFQPLADALSTTERAHDMQVVYLPSYPTQQNSPVSSPRLAVTQKRSRHARR